MDRALSCVRANTRDEKPRRRGIAEIRGPVLHGCRSAYLDLFETMGEYVDALKFAGGSFSLMPRAASKPNAFASSMYADRGAGALADNGLDEPARRHEHVVPMTHADDGGQGEHSTQRPQNTLGEV